MSLFSTLARFFSGFLPDPNQPQLSRRKVEQYRRERIRARRDKIRDAAARIAKERDDKYIREVYIARVVDMMNGDEFKSFVIHAAWCGIRGGKQEPIIQPTHKDLAIVEHLSGHRWGDLPDMLRHAIWCITRSVLAPWFDDVPWPEDLPPYEPL